MVDECKHEWKFIVCVNNGINGMYNLHQCSICKTVKNEEVINAMFNKGNGLF